MKLFVLFVLVLSTIAVAASLPGCAKTEPTLTVAYYKEHHDERRTKLKECASNPGEKAAAPNCINAQEADRQGSFGTSELKFQ